MRATPPMPAAACCSTSTKAPGTQSLLKLLGVPAAAAAQGRRLLGRARRRHRRHPRRAGAGAGHGGRPAGRDRGPGLHQARHGQGDLRHGLLCAAEHRQHGRALAQSAAHHHRLSARRPADLCAGGQHLHRRRRRAMAARRPAPDRQVVRRRAGRGPRQARSRRLHGAGLRRPGRALLGCRRARRAAGADARHRPGRDRRGHARFGVLPDARPGRGHARRRRADRRAAGRRRHGGERSPDAAAGRHRRPCPSSGPR